MKPLVLDFLRRWRWLIIISLLISIASTIMGAPFVLSQATVVVLLLDAQRGVFRAVRPLPVTRIDQARAWWFVGVPFLPLLSAPAMMIGVLLFQQFNPAGNSQRFRLVAPAPISAPAELEMPSSSGPTPTPKHIALPGASVEPVSPWFAAGVQLWIALGYAAFCFFLIQWAPTRPPESLAENVQQATFGALWGVSIPGAVFLLPNLPRAPEAVATWHWALFVATPIFFTLSYSSATELLKRRMAATSVKLRPEPIAESKAIGSGLAGIPLYLATFPTRIALFVGMIACVQLVVFRTIIRGPQHNPALAMQVSLMGLAIGAVVAESVGMRALRMLPISTRKLAILLLFIPWVGAVTSALFSVVWCRTGNPEVPSAVSLFAQSIALCGWATLAFAVLMHMVSSGRLFVLMLLLMIPAMGQAFLAKHTLILAATGSLVGLVGYALLIRGLRKSSAFYQPRGFFGMTPSQPSAVR